MITKEQALNLTRGQKLHYTGNHECTRKVGKRGGVKVSVMEVRVTGKCQTWKTNPGLTQTFRVPVKFGLYESGAITDNNAADFHFASECPLERSMTERDVTHAVFEVVDWNGHRSFAVIVYVALMGNISRGAALPKIKEFVKERYPNSKINFGFWADDGSSHTGPTPIEVRL